MNCGPAQPLAATLDRVEVRGTSPPCGHCALRRWAGDPACRAAIVHCCAGRGTRPAARGHSGPQRLDGALHAARPLWTAAMGPGSAPPRTVTLDRGDRMGARPASCGHSGPRQRVGFLPAARFHSESRRRDGRPGSPREATLDRGEGTVGSVNRAQRLWTAATELETCPARAVNLDGTRQRDEGPSPPRGHSGPPRRDRRPARRPRPLWTAVSCTWGPPRRAATLNRVD